MTTFVPVQQSQSHYRQTQVVSSSPTRMVHQQHHIQHLTQQQKQALMAINNHHQQQKQVIPATVVVQTQQQQPNVIPPPSSVKSQHSANSVVSTSAATAGNTTNTTATNPKVSNINVADERFHLSLITLLGCVLGQLVAFEESQYPNGRGTISMFHTAYVPSISIGSYLKRIALYTKVSTEVLIQSVLHVHQLMQRNQNPLIVNKLNIHRLLLTSVMTTAKWFDDAHYNNAYFSYVGGVPLKELNALEVEFLSLLNFDFYVNEQTYLYFYSMVIERNIHQNGCQCTPVLSNVPKTIVMTEYNPNSEPIEEMCEPEPDYHMEDPRASPSISCTTSRGSSMTPPQSSISGITHVSSSSSMADMGDEIHSLHLKERGISQSSSSSASSNSQDDCMSSTPEAPYPSKISTGTPCKTPIAMARPHQLQSQRSSSPVSFLSTTTSALSSAITDSPVSSVGSYSSYNPSMRMPMHHSPSLSCSRIDSYNIHSRYGVIEEQSYAGDDCEVEDIEEDHEINNAVVNGYFASTPKQNNNMTPLANNHEMKEDITPTTSHLEVEQKERQLEHQHGHQRNIMM